MQPTHFILIISLAAASLAPVSAATPNTVAEAIRVIRAVGPEGKGNVEASQAWKQLVQAAPADLPTVLAGLDGANDFAVNWLRSAAETIASRDPSRIPMPALTTFLQETRHHPRARRLAYEFMIRRDPGLPDRLLPGLLNDPSLELRRDAVQRRIDLAQRTLEGGDKSGAASEFRQMLGFARDLDQIEGLTKSLKELGQTVDLPELFGFLTTWKVIGPFDNVGGVGFEQVFPPEQKVDLAAEYDGKSGKVRWQDYTSKQEYGMVDINQPFGKLKGTTAYAYTEFVSDKAQAVELRLGCKNAWKVWCNGKLLFGRDEYHAGAEIDQYRMPVELKPGRNAILVKVCQNEQMEDWTVEWEFQLRVCDSLGTAIRPSAAPAVAAESKR